MNNFYMIGINYKDINLAGREKFIKNNPEKFIKEFKEKNVIKGYVLLVTCLRIEFYIHLNNNKNYEEILNEVKFFKEKTYFLKGLDAINYLFKVICGFDSIIKGEDQILAQIKKTYLKALEEKHTTPEMNKIFNNAIALGKKFRAESAVTSKPLSLERIAARFIERHFSQIKNKKVFIIGTGELSQSILYILKKDGVKDIVITNRTTHKTRIIEQKFEVETVPFEKKYELINQSDIIISATSAPHFIIKFEELKDHLTIDKERFFLDLAVPRDIEENIAEIPGVNLYNLDNLWESYNNNIIERNDISAQYEYLINEQVSECLEWFQKRKEVYAK